MDANAWLIPAQLNWSKTWVWASSNSCFGVSCFERKLSSPLPGFAFLLKGTPFFFALSCFLLMLIFDNSSNLWKSTEMLLPENYTDSIWDDIQDLREKQTPLSFCTNNTMSKLPLKWNYHKDPGLTSHRIEWVHPFILPRFQLLRLLENIIVFIYLKYFWPIFPSAM